MIHALWCIWLYAVASFLLAFLTKCWARSTGRACKPLFAWFDFWVGIYVDRAKGRVYVFPVPMLGFYVDLAAVNTLLFTRSWDGFDVRTWRTDYWVNRQRVAQWYELTEGLHVSKTMKALVAVHPHLTTKALFRLWNRRKAA